MKESRFRGLGTFSAIWAGQVLSLLGTGMTQFAMTIWAWQKIGQATALAAVGGYLYRPLRTVERTIPDHATLRRRRKRLRRPDALQQPHPVSGRVTAAIHSSNRAWWVPRQ